VLLAKLAHPRVVEPSVDRTIGRAALLSVGGAYEQ
jgi:hypothetical protein